MPSWGEISDWIINLQQDHGLQAYDIAFDHYITQLQSLTGRDTVLYMTDWTQPQGSGHNQSITNSDMQGFMEVVKGKESPNLDLILHSPGGSVEAVEQITNYLRNHYRHIRIFVPQAAKSAATLMCCAADEVVMGDHSSLGPIDPQIQVNTQFGMRLAPAYSILDQFEQAQREYERDGEIGAWGPILTQYGPGLLAECDDAIELSQELAATWAATYMMDEEEVDAGLHKDLAGYLSRRENFRSHSRPISRSDVSEMGMNVARLESDDELQDRVLSTFHAASIMLSDLNVEKIIRNHKENRYVYFSGTAHEREVESEESKEEE